MVKIIGKIHLDNETVDEVYNSQAGNYRHRREGLQHRLQIAEKNNIWTPKKRTFKNNKNISFLRKKIYESRYQLSKVSHIYFKEAKDKNKSEPIFFEDTSSSDMVLFLEWKIAQVFV